MYVYRCCTRIVSSFVFTPISNLHVDCLDSLRGERQKSLTLIGDSGWGFFFQDHNQNRNGAQKTGTAVQSVRFQWQIPAVSISRTHTPKSILQLLKSMQNISKLHSANKTYTYMHVRRTGWHPGILAAIA